MKNGIKEWRKVKRTGEEKRRGKKEKERKKVIIFWYFLTALQCQAVF